MDHAGEETDCDRDVEEHQGVRDDHNKGVLRTFKLDVVFDGALSQVICFHCDNFHVGVCCLIVSKDGCNITYKFLVVVDSFHRAIHRDVVIIADGIVETLDVPDEDLGLPGLSRLESELIMLEEESKLHATGVQDALVTL